MTSPPPTTVGPSAASSPRLLVLEVVPSAASKTLRTLDTQTRHPLSVTLCHEWLSSPVRQSDIIRVLLTRPDGTYLPWPSPPSPPSHPVFITRETNLLILHPDTLVSGTSIADSFLCLRKALLTARVPPRNLLQSAGGEAALFGSIIHALFQHLLALVFDHPHHSSRPKPLDPLQVYDVVETVLHQHLHDLYAANISDLHARLVLHKVLPSITEWFAAFAAAEDGARPPGLRVPGGKDVFHLAVDAVCDIEELVWSPIFGLKGKIDASVRLRQPGLHPSRVAAVELKTGSSVGFASVSHAAQLNLYNLLMSDRYGDHVSLGLLSYIRYQEALKAVKEEQAAGDGGAHANISLIETRGNFAQQPNNKAVSFVRGEIVGLIMQRNEFASYATLDSHVRTLPPLLQGREDLCAKCFANDSCMIQHRLLEGGTRQSVEGGPGPEVFREKAAHLTDDHASYYAYWRGVLADEEATAARPRSEVWNLRASQREALGRCLANLRLVDDSAGSHDRQHNYLLPPGQRLTSTFQRHGNSKAQTPLKDSALAENDFVLVSAESLNSLADKSPSSLFTWQSALTNGFIQSVSSSAVTVVMDRSLFAWARNQGVDINDVVWRIDTEEIYSSYNTAKRTLENLFCSDQFTNLGRLRSLVVDGIRPRFSDIILGSDPATCLKSFNLSLNTDQNRALQMALRAQDYLLVLGMPGTGKTTTLAAIVLAYASQGKSVLLCSHTNSAVDNLLQRLLAAGFFDFVRLGRNMRVINSAIHPYHVSKLTAHATTTKDLETALDKPMVVGTTCLGIHHPLLVRRGRFDLVVVDEASQVLQPICMGPLQFAAGPFILVGDHYQLPPLLRSQQTHGHRMQEMDDRQAIQACTELSSNGSRKESQMNESLFRRLCKFHPEAMISLSRQYRMSYEIMRLSNELVYSGSLSCGSDEVAQQRLDTTNSPTHVNAQWLRSVIDPSKAVVFLDMPDRADEEGQGAKSDRTSDGDASRRDNVEEAKVVCQCISALEEVNVNPDSITVLSPFRAQVGLISECLQKRPAADSQSLRSVNVYTIDQYQGRDSNCVIVSFVRCTGSVGPLLKDWRRINVALTRAKQKLILVGSSKTLMRGGYFLKGMVTLLESDHCIFPVSRRPS